MSADNRICVMEWQDEWYVWDGSCSCDYFEPPSSECGKTFETEDQALEYAREKASKMYILEGGITIVSIEEQKTALENTIEHFKGRLDRLNTIGKQYDFD